MRLFFYLDIPKIRRNDEGRDFAEALIEHLLSTFNDDCAIKSITYTLPKHLTGGSQP